MRLRFFAWIRFLRLPNALTVPGDVWVGAVTQIGSLEAGIRTTSGVVFAYWFGMALNDLLDLPRDRRSRPERPLPSGQISPGMGWTVCVLLGLTALGLSPSVGMAGLILLIVAYTGCKEPIPWLGPILMALCRVCALWIGAGSPLQPSPQLIAAAVIWFLWIGWITVLGRLEATERPVPLYATLWMAILGLGVPLWVLSQTDEPLSASLFAVLWIWALVQLDLRLRRAGCVQPALIGKAIRVLLPLQSLMLAGAGEPLLGVCLLPVWPLLAWLSRRFPMS